MNNKIAVVYFSRYGSTKRYAEWLSEELQANLYDGNRVKMTQLSDAEILLIGGGIYAGSVNGAKWLCRYAEELKDKQILFFTVGVAPVDDPGAFQEVLSKSFAPSIRQKIHFFHLRGGMDYKELSFRHRMMMAMMVHFLKKKPIKEQTEDDKTMIQTYGGKLEFLNKKAIEPVVSYIQGIVNE